MNYEKPTQKLGVLGAMAAMMEFGARDNWINIMPGAKPRRRTIVSQPGRNQRQRRKDRRRAWANGNRRAFK